MATSGEGAVGGRRGRVSADESRGGMVVADEEVGERRGEAVELSDAVL
jgi:hypothetical protein